MKIKVSLEFDAPNITDDPKGVLLQEMFDHVQMAAAKHHLEIAMLWLSNKMQAQGEIKNEMVAFNNEWAQRLMDAKLTIETNEKTNPRI